MPLTRDATRTPFWIRCSMARLVTSSVLAVSLVAYCRTSMSQILLRRRGNYNEGSLADPDRGPDFWILDMDPANRVQ
jgi:hypothetical protein